MPGTLPLESVRQATANGAGVAVVNFPAVGPWHQWEVRRLSVTSTSAARTSAAVYRNSVNAANQLDTAPFSGNDDTSDTVIGLQAGESLVVAWAGATVGARCTCSISGTDTDRG